MNSPQEMRAAIRDLQKQVIDLEILVLELAEKLKAKDTNGEKRPYRRRIAQSN